MDIMRRVVTLFEVRGAQQIQASMGQMAGGFGSLRRELDTTGRSTGYVNGQLRALGTTLRYTIAGTTIFGTLQLVRTLGQFQARLGEISSIATGPGGIPIVGQQLDDLGERLIDVSNRTTEPIDELQQGVISLYSTIGDVPENQAAKMMETFSKTAITTQANVNDTTNALLALINAFGESTDAIGKYGNEFFKVIQESSNMTGAQFSQQLGRLSSSAAYSRFSPEQMMALAIGSTRFGGSAETNMNNLAQLLLYVTTPRTASEKAAYASIGLGPNVRNRMSGWDILMRILEETNKRGGVGMSSNFATASDEMLQGAIDAGMTPQQMGLQGGGSNLLYQLFGRIQSTRIAAILSRMVQPSQVAGTENKTLNQYLSDVSSGADDVDKAMDRAMDRRRIVQASNAMHNLGIEIGNVLNPLINLGATGVTAGVEGFTGQGRGAQIGELAGGATGVALLLRRLSRAGLRRGAGGLLGAGALTGAALDAMTGGAQRGDSPLNPVYVAVVYSLSGAAGSIMGIPNRDLRTAGAELGAGEVAAGRASRFSRFGGLRTAGGILAGVSGIELGYELLKSERQQGLANQARYNQPISHHALLNYLRKTRAGGVDIPLPFNPFGGGGFNGINIGGHSVATDAQKRILDRLKSGAISEDTAERLLRQVATTTQLRATQLTRLRGTADVNITLTDKQGNERGKKSVTLDLFPQFTTPAPQTKSKPKTMRGGQQ